MRIHVFGSINLDKVYRVPHLVRPGETLSSLSVDTLLGGKGANQSVALARAGASVAHVGRLCREDSGWLQTLLDAGVDTQRVELVDTISGHAIIQVDDAGENAIVLHGGANRGFDRAALQGLLEPLEAGDWLLLQNECDALADAMAIARLKGARIAFNPAPMDASVQALPLAQLDLLIVNQTEAAMLLQLDINTPEDELLNALQNHLPSVMRVLTLGERGACLFEPDSSHRHHRLPPPVEIIDTTGAGDTFVGYLLAALVSGSAASEALERAVTAGAMAVAQAGATPSIPSANDVDALIGHSVGDPQ